MTEESESVFLEVSRLPEAEQKALAQWIGERLGQSEPEPSTLTRPGDGQWIRSVPGYLGGRPHIAGTRIKVQFIAIWHERMALSPDEIASDYDLPLGAIYAALAYYFDHRAEIDAHIEEDETYVESMRRQTSSLVEAKLRGEDHPLLHR